MKGFSQVAFAVLLFLGVASYGFAQDPGMPDMGLRPFGPYIHADIYHVNLANGNVYGQIPIASYPQKGKLPPLTFLLTFNTSPFVQESVCIPFSDICVNYYDNGTYPAGVNLTTSYGLGFNGVSGTQIGEGAYADCHSGSPGNPYYVCTPPEWFIEQWALSDITGSNHLMLFDKSNKYTLYAGDGSGYRLDFPPNSSYSPDNVFNPPPPGVIPVVHAPDGLTYEGGGSTITDPFGNAVRWVAGTWSQSGAWIAPTIQDSMNRVFPDPGSIGAGATSEYSNDISMCPNIGTGNQNLLYSVTVNLPGVNGTSEPYIMCYARIGYHPGFYGFDPSQGDPSMPSPCTTCIWQDGDPITTLDLNLLQGFDALQAVILPTKDYWGFVYDTGSVLSSGGIDYTPETYGTISKIIYPTGASASFSYINTGVVPASPVASPPAYRSLHSVVLDDGLGNLSTTKYAYRGYNTVPAGVSVVVTDGAGNDTTHTLTSFGCGIGASCYAATPPAPSTWPSYETQTVSYQGSAAGGQALKTVNTQYQVIGQSPYNYVAAFPQAVTTLLGDTFYNQTVNQYPALFTAYNQDCNIGFGCTEIPTGAIPYGKPFQVSTYDGSGNLLLTETSSPLYTSVSAYKKSNMLDLTASSQVSDGNGTQVAFTSYGYDQASSGSASGSNGTTYGNLTSMSQWLNTSGQYLTTTTSFDTSGAPWAPSLINDPKGNQTSIPTYQCSGMYPATVIKAYLSSNTVPETTSYTYDCTTGSLLSVVDPNKTQTQVLYNDPLGRQTQVKRSVGTPYENWTTMSYPSMTQMSIAQDKATKGDGAIVSSTTYDGLGRPTRTVNPAGAIVDTSYDLVHNTVYVSNPYYGPGPNTSGGTTRQLDALGRPSLLTHADNTSQTWNYTGNTVTFTDENKHTWSRTNDALGRLAQVIEPVNGTPTNETDYGYDVLNNLLSVTQVGQMPSESIRSRNFVYDSLSRLTSATNPETGTVSYIYDPDGNVQTKSDARGVNITYSYDALNRLLSKTYSDGATPASCYQYDSSPNGIGRLGNAWTQKASLGSCAATPATKPYLTMRSILSYDLMGHILQEQQFTPVSQATGTVYAPAYTYDLAGNLMTSTDGVTPAPTQTSVSAPCLSSPLSSTTLTFINCMDSGGHLQTLMSNWTDATHPMWLFSASPSTSAPSYAPFGGLMNATFGNGLALSRTYDKRLRITSETDTGSNNWPGMPGSTKLSITGAEQSR